VKHPGLSHWRIAHDYLAAEVRATEDRLRAESETPEPDPQRIRALTQELAATRTALEENEAEHTMDALRSLILPLQAAGGKLYAIGGWDPLTPGVLATVEEYNPVTNSWTAKASMPTPRTGLVAVALNGTDLRLRGL
jgi:hypothetical protein